MSFTLVSSDQLIIPSIDFVYEGNFIVSRATNHRARMFGVFTFGNPRLGTNLTYREREKQRG